MISFTDFSVNYGRRSVIKNATVLANDGEITVLLGKNGSGKTTLLRSIFSTRGMVSHGNVEVDGVSLSALSPRRLALVVSLLPQNLPSSEFSVGELVALGRAPYLASFGVLGKDDILKVDAALERLSLTNLKDRAVSTLSGGERQRAYFAMLLAKDTHNVLLDEPTASLDTEREDEILRFLCEQKAEGKCVIAVMHDLSAACRIADRIYVIREGEVTRPLTPAEFIDSTLPEDVFSQRAYSVKTEYGERTVFLPLE